MATRMLIDARHSEETRVAVLKGNRIEEFDFESAEHKQIKGNIYLAKVTRVEPSLQAAFVDFGGNRHGFLAFSEIHPDYYQIPYEDRQRLLAEEAEAAEEEQRLRDEEESEGIAPGDEYDAEDESGESLAEDFAEDGVEEIDDDDNGRVSTIEDGALDDDSDDDSDDSNGEDDSDDENGDNGGSRRGRARRGRRQPKGRGNAGSRGGSGRSRAKEVDEVRAKRMALRRRYKIQDVIQRRQVLLVQVVKEERGNKGAALTTYLSLAGRYTVLMPNSSHGGGISRKINSTSDRKRLKQIVSDLKLPRTMGLIVRTAGLSRTRTEIKRDFDYLARLWDEIREKTLASTAPSLIHSDSDLVKRAIRDIYNREIEEVIVEGEEGYKAAKGFMKLLMPSHARRVKAYSDPVPLFQRYGAEDQLRAMYDPMVQLKSGGYLIINPTEALVSIDINSGRSTKEHGIEQTALHTNLEAAKEIARQLRLRDMAGLVVIDFIDMEHNSNVRKVEKAMKEALKNDRARIQVGRISGFGLMEMSRQRLRTGVLEATTRECPHCDGTGLVRTASSAGLSALRLIEDEAAKGKGTIIRLAASTEAAIYLLNEKRDDLVEIEQRYGVRVEVIPEGENEGAKMHVSSAGPKPASAPRFDPIVDDEEDEDLPEEDTDEEEDNASEESSAEDDGTPRKKKRRRRRGGRGRKKRQDGDENGENGSEESSDGGEETGSGGDDETAENGDEKPKKRSRRGGRGRSRRQDDDSFESADEALEQGAEQLEEVAEQVREDMTVVSGPDDAPETAGEMAQEAAAAEEKPRRKRAPRRKKGEEAAAEAAAEAPAETGADSAASTEEAAASEKPKRKRAPRKKKDEAEAKVEAVPTGSEAAAEAEPEPEPEPQSEPKPKTPRRRKAPAKQAEDAGAGESLSADAGEPASPAERESEPAEAEEAETRPASSDAGQPDAKPAPAKRGWWQRTFGE
ncbi:ribonuclease E/G [Erythrobacter sp. HL-111]|uniref:Rne/Rng family ribonuclease n=1 Tax=Erythrobacter sp. HL-111 TaxID=1798193 RepID=UPI0006DB81FD|nr:ribonuclease E/G [Erythrobacter sp. HL-111]KPP96598.1 MAG: ribonuclease E Rne [Erythrobacteraceae bacterium HL-111]SDS01980.1 RNAse E [Erythrobacter sp. HL-111]